MVDNGLDMGVFTSQYVRAIRSRFDPLPEYQRPPIYWLATARAHQSTRAEIEKWVAGLPQPARKRMIPNLRAPETMVQTYHELAVGSILKRLGYHVEYERPMATLAPDWYVHATARTPAFIVEVFSSGLPQAAVSRDSQTEDLLGRLRGIPSDVKLLVVLHQTGIELGTKVNKTIAGRVRRWLLNDCPAVGTQLSSHGLVFEIMARDVGRTSVEIVAHEPALLVDPRPLGGKLEKKIRRYGRPCREDGTPLAIAVVADPRTGLDLDDLAEALLGKEVVTVSLHRKSGAIIDQRATRTADGLLVKGMAELSAVLWVWRLGGEWHAAAFHNPNAVSPLPLNAFGEG